MAGEAQGSTTFYTYTADEASRDALTATEITEGGIVGVGADADVGGGYAEYRVLTTNTTFADSTVQRVWPHMERAVLGTDGGSPTIGVETAYYNDFTIGAPPAPRFEGDEYASSVLPAASTDDAATKTAAWATGREITHYIAIDNGGTLEWAPNSSQAEGLRGTPVADNAALTALVARDYERRKVLADDKEYVFTFGAMAHHWLGTSASSAAKSKMLQGELAEDNVIAPARPPSKL